MTLAFFSDDPDTPTLNDFLQVRLAVRGTLPVDVIAGLLRDELEAFIARDLPDMLNAQGAS